MPRTALDQSRVRGARSSSSSDGLSEAWFVLFIVVSFGWFGEPGAYEPDVVSGLEMG